MMMMMIIMLFGEDNNDDNDDLFDDGQLNRMNIIFTNCHFSNLGTGKTATFAIGILQKLDVSMRDCQALILGKI